MGKKLIKVYADWDEFLLEVELPKVITEENIKTVLEESTQHFKIVFKKELEKAMESHIDLIDIYDIVWETNLCDQFLLTIEQTFLRLLKLKVSVKLIKPDFSIKIGTVEA